MPALTVDQRSRPCGDSIGSPVVELAERFAPWDLANTLQDAWWYQGDKADPEWRPKGTYLTIGEPAHAFRQRIASLMILLEREGAAADVQTVALVAHSETIKALTGKYVANCGVVELRTSDLPAIPYVDV